MIRLFKSLIGFCVIVIANGAYDDNNCFIAKENGKIIKQLGKCDGRHAPFSTFKIAIAVMEFDANILKSPLEPVVKTSDEIKQSLESSCIIKRYPTTLLWKSDSQNPLSWMTYSVVWYSQWITKQLGMEKFKNYVNILNYGNKDVSGDPRENNGLTHAWLNTSLRISPLEQVNFVEKLSQKQLPLSIQAQENTIKLIEQEKIWDDWQLYGKTGGGINGWFVGWIEKDYRRIVFAQYIDQQPDMLISSGRKARELAKDNLISLMFPHLK